MNPSRWDEQLDSEFFLRPLMDDNENGKEKIKTGDWLLPSGGDDK